MKEFEVSLNGKVITKIAITPEIVKAFTPKNYEKRLVTKILGELIFKEAINQYASKE